MARFKHLTFYSIENISFEGNDDTVIDFSVIYNGLRLDCRLNRKVISDYMIVAPNGAVNREKDNIPAFARWNWHGVLNCSILSISDPAFYLNEELKIGWFAGTKYLDIPRFTVDVVKKVASLLNLPQQKIIFWGSSAGGYSSILLSSKLQGSKFVSINGQTTILNYYKNHVEDLRKLFDFSKSSEQASLTYPLRWSAIESLRNSYKREAATSNVGVIAQNILDVKHYEEHYKPFCEKFRLPLEGGSNKDLGLYSLQFSDEKGHGPENATIAKILAEEYIPKLLLG